MPPGTIWTAEEDLELRRYVRELGEKKWAQISSCIKTKTSKQCRRRWLNHLNMESKKCGWSPQEDVKLVELHKTYGNKWTEIAKMIGGRTDNAVKNRFHALARKDEKAKAQSSTLFYNAEYANDFSATYLNDLKERCHNHSDRHLVHCDCSLEKLRAELNARDSQQKLEDASSRAQSLEDARMRAVQAIDDTPEMTISKRPHDLTIVIPQDSVTGAQPLPVGQIFVQQGLLSPVEKKLAEEVNDMDEVPVHISFMNEEAETPEIMDYTALHPDAFSGGHTVTVANGAVGENTLCLFPSAGSILETLKTNCTPRGTEVIAPWDPNSVSAQMEGGGEYGNSSVATTLPSDSSLGCLNDGHKRLLTKLFTEGKRPASDMSNNSLPSSSVPVDGLVEPEAIKQEDENPQNYRQREDAKRKRMSDRVRSIVPNSPFDNGLCPASAPPTVLSPSVGVQLSPIFSQVGLESLLNAISPLSSLPSQDLMDFLAATSQAAGCRIIDTVQLEPVQDVMEVDEWACSNK